MTLCCKTQRLYKMSYDIIGDIRRIPVPARIEASAATVVHRIDPAICPAMGQAPRASVGKFPTGYFSTAGEPHQQLPYTH
jgi:hypothetical protein